MSETKTPATARKGGKLLLRIPVGLHEDLARLAARNDLSVNRTIMGILADAMLRMEARRRSDG
jgi:predicted HicB family RNase H-like nuclease